MAKDFDQLTQEVLALAWCQLNKPLWEGRLEMGRFLREHFYLPSEVSNGKTEGQQEQK